MHEDTAPEIAPESLLGAELRVILDLVLNMIVPPSADGRMPGAAEVGVPDYLIAEAADGLRQFKQELERLDAQARIHFGRGFARLQDAERWQVVAKMRAEEPLYMSRLVAEVLACYYQHDRVLAGLGMEARPPYPKGYAVPESDLTLLEPVRARGKIYRDAP